MIKILKAPKSILSDSAVKAEIRDVKTSPFFSLYGIRSPGSQKFRLAQIWAGDASFQKGFSPSEERRAFALRDAATLAASMRTREDDVFLIWGRKSPAPALWYQGRDAETVADARAELASLEKSAREALQKLKGAKSKAPKKKATGKKAIKKKAKKKLRLRK